MLQIPGHVIFAVLIAVLNHIGLSIPRADDTAIEREVTTNVEVHGILCKNVLGSSGTILAKITLWSSTAIQVARTFALEQPYTSLGAYLLTCLPSTMLHSKHLEDTDSSWALPTIAGLAVILSGVVLNLASRYTLGSFAAYPIVCSSPRTLYVPPSLVATPRQESSSKTKASQTWTLRHSHRLITSGPYRYVRHPMYSGILLSFVGTGIVYLSNGSLLDVIASDMFAPTYRSTPLTLFLILGLSTAMNLVGRARREDVALDSAFGKGAAFFRWNVPYSFIPGIY